METRLLRTRMPLAVGAAVVSIFAFPPFDLWWCASIGFALWCLSVYRAPTKHALAVGFVSGSLFFAGLMPWLRVVGPDAWVLLALFCGGYIAVTSIAAAWVTWLRGWPFLVSALWILQEFVRARFPLGGYPWGNLAFSQSESPFTPMVSLLGTAGLSFAVALCGATLAWSAQRLLDRGRLDQSALAAAIIALLLPWLGMLIPLSTGGTNAVAAVVQGNVPQNGLDAFAQREAVLRNHVQAAERLAAEVAVGNEPQPDFVIWPENSSDIDPFTNPDAYALIQQAVDALKAPTLVGLVVPAPDGSGLLNTGTVWSPQTGPGQQYVKQHPVPFGEYVPFRDFLAQHISRFDRVPRNFVAGQEPGILNMNGTSVGDVICFEVAYDQVVRDTVNAGAEILAVQTNNATYGRTGQVEQQLAISRLRAVEYGRSVLVAATSGISAVIAPDGTIVSQTQEFTQASLVETVTLRSDETLADRLGSLPEYGLAGVGLVGLVLAAIARRGRRQASPPPVELPEPVRSQDPA